MLQVAVAVAAVMVVVVVVVVLLLPKLNLRQNDEICHHYQLRHQHRGPPV